MSKTLVPKNCNATSCEIILKANSVKILKCQHNNLSNHYWGPKMGLTFSKEAKRKYMSKRFFSRTTMLHYYICDSVDCKLCKLIPPD